MFKFRLQKLLSHREREEQEAKRNFMERRAAKVSGEAEIASIRRKRKELGVPTEFSVLLRLDLMDRFAKTDDDESAAQIVLGVLTDEEEAAERAWIHAKRELQVIEKLRENKFTEWQGEEERRAQNALDEWAVLRRTA